MTRSALRYAGGHFVVIEMNRCGISVFVEAAALEEAAGGKDEKERSGSLHESNGVERGRESEVLGNHTAKKDAYAHSKVP